MVPLAVLMAAPMLQGASCVPVQLALLYRGTKRPAWMKTSAATTMVDALTLARTVMEAFNVPVLHRTHLILTGEPVVTLMNAFKAHLVVVMAVSMMLGDSDVLAPLVIPLEETERCVKT